MEGEVKGSTRSFSHCFLEVFLQEIIQTGWHSFRLHFLTRNIKHIFFFPPSYSLIRKNPLPWTIGASSIVDHCLDGLNTATFHFSLQLAFDLKSWEGRSDCWVVTHVSFTVWVSHSSASSPQTPSQFCQLAQVKSCKCKSHMFLLISFFVLIPVCCHLQLTDLFTAWDAYWHEGARHGCSFLVSSPLQPEGAQPILSASISCSLPLSFFSL